MSQSDAPARWQAIWADRGWRARLLWPLSLLYGALGGMRRRRFIRGTSVVVRMPVPVIVVGNVVVGGAGKTPTVLALLSHLKSAGWQPGVVSRGHGRNGQGVLELRPDTPAAESGDEPALIRLRAGVPVFVGRQRAEAAQALLAAHPEVNVLVCDDGLQHLALGRDIGIAVFDDRGPGNGWLLPAGLLREPWPPAAGNPFAPQLVLQQHRAGSDLSHRPPLALPVGAQAFGASRRLVDLAIGPAGRSCPLTALQGTDFIAVAGIARPEVFFAMLRERGLCPAHTVALPDHADNSAFDVLRRSPAATVVCTEKDAVKLSAIVEGWPAAERPTVWAVPLELQIEAGFFVHVDRLLEACAPGARLSSTDGHQTA